MRAKIRKWILKPLLIKLITLIVLVGVALILIITEQQKIVNLAIDKLNQQIAGRVIFETSRLSLFKHFPSVGVALNEVTVLKDKNPGADTIAHLTKLYVSVSIPALLEEQYNVRRISLHEGYVNTIKASNGRFNVMDAFEMASATSSADTTQNEKALEIDLEKVSFKKVRLRYTDETTGRKYSTAVEQLTSSFSSDSSRMTVSVVSDMELDYTSERDTSFFRHKKFNIDFVADYNLHRKVVKVMKGNFQLQEASFNLEGTADLSGEPIVDFRIKGDKPDFNLLTAFLPGDVKLALKPFRYDGRIHFDGVVKGEVSDELIPLIKVNFGCEDAWFINESVDEKLDQLAFKGYYTNGVDHSLKTSELHIMNVNARPGKGIFKGNFVMRDFTDPHILMQVQSELELKFVGDFFGIHDLRQFAGDIKLEMDFNEIVDIETPEQSLTRLKDGVQSKLEINNLSFRVPGYPHQIKDVTLRAEMKKGRVTLDSALIRIGGSDLQLSGSLSDIDGFLHNAASPIKLMVNARSRNILLNELLSYDTALAHQFDEEIHHLNVGLTLETSVAQLLNPQPLPMGTFEVKNLRASFKKYPHALKNMDANVRVSDSTLVVWNFSGMIDSSDMKLSGRVNNYKLWFQDVMLGKTQLDFDFRSNRFAFDDVFVKGHRKFIPRGYRREQLNNVVLKAKVDLKYDTVFRFAKAEISNVTGQMKKHNFALKDIQGKFRYGANRVLALDSLKGSFGKSDFDVSMRLYHGKDRQKKKKTNYFHFASKVLDLDEILAYDFSTPPSRRRKDSTKVVVAVVDTTAHAKAFNVFALPFSDFNVQVDIGRLRYNKLRIRDLSAKVRLTEDHFLHVDTVALKIAGGTVGLKGQLDASDTTRLFLTSTLNVQQVDLEKVMLKLDRFGQDVVINKNIKGTLTGLIRSNVQIHPDLVPLMDNSTARLNVKIYNGSLVDFAPMQAMAGYFQDKNLRMVRFDTLENELTFEKGQLSIPSMNINSSLGSIEMSGKQSLDMRMEYYLRIPLKMVTQVGFNALFDKKQSAVDSAQVDEISLGKDKRTRFVNVKVTGTPDDFKVSLGRGRAGN